MADLAIYIGYRTVSSWSLRAWLMLKKTGQPFDETLMRYRTTAGKQALNALSPTGKVPLLVHRRRDLGGGRGEIKVWDSIAIGEYLAETFPKSRLWPEDVAARAHARAIAAEMHSGFRPLREHLSMALLERLPNPNNPQANADVDRIEKMWRTCRDAWGKNGEGPFLFGHYTVADAMYAPVATRFRTYGVKLGATATAYLEAVLSDPDFRAWEAAAMKDPAPEPPTP
jgi:glutathione S-transferase